MICTFGTILMEVGLSDDMPVDCIKGEDKSNLNFITERLEEELITYI